ncbi:hypothetical protein [Flavisolibacter ginsenosidimutans]|uniref:Uncharacterized protein n=1 Tax=Flavisolibacter ginsenosidimutans TaxID=661481 RepID=A0A5B8UMS3_9BACT|nr:hypothetical protein [Flavisolibacter ginsenosidimutans]QEC57977.1 hypothetical protein FSB75_19380 [Flavisolibacter ginsenosidimutans]
MINTKQLRAGNWVMKILTTKTDVNAFYEYKVIGEDEYYFTFANVYFPIALAPDILGKSGFQHSFGDWYKNTEAEGIDGGIPFLRFKHKTGQWYLFDHPLPFQPQYLHQLQNLYYGLTQKELVVALGPFANTEAANRTYSSVVTQRKLFIATPAAVIA